MELVALLTQGGVANFLLLILRFSGIIAFFPFFDSKLIPISLKGVMVFFLALLFFPIVPPFNTEIGMLEFMFMGFSEIMLGFFAAFFLQAVFSAIAYAGDILGFSIGMSVASNYDPISSTQNMIISQILTLVTLLIALSLDFHHIIFFLVAKSIDNIPLGGFMFSDNMLIYFIKHFGNMFIIGFTIAFPIVGIILLSDIIFGMITRAHPQFNLLIIGLPVKLIVALAVLIIVFPAMIYHFKEELMSALKFIAQIAKF